ncbi:MAG: Na/Pi cotransporter family protein [Phycisphaeraceae bacterium]|nr:Na/Pi cotransporter family protein [Phycisphaeraceae bacterium]
MVVALLGGIGLFLLGMLMMSDGLKSMAGDSLRQVLMRVIRGPWSGLAAGAAATAVVQSSTATTLTTIGFVSAGLLTFPQSIGVIVGSNLGTTSTGWIVSLLGLKISLGTLAPPLVLAGVALRLLGRGGLRAGGDALAGFALIFIGIDLLQSGISHLATQINLAGVGGEGVGGRLIMVGIGFVMTVLMQSSSAAVATTIVAISTGAITMEQAAALVIGQNIGTTPKAVIAVIGAPVPAVRTAAVHITFNVVTGVVAFLILPVFLRLVVDVMEAEHASPATALAAFHTAFNGLGTLLIMPCVRPLSKAIERIIPERRESMTSHLSSLTAVTGSVAIEAARRAMSAVIRRMARCGLDALDRGLPPSRIHEQAIEECRRALEEVGRFHAQFSRSAHSEAEVRDTASMFHAADHLRRLLVTLRELTPPSLPITGVASSEISSAVTIARTMLHLALDDGERGEAAVQQAASLSAQLAVLRKDGRLVLLDSAAKGMIPAEAAIARVETLLRLDRLCYHLWRTMHHLVPAQVSSAPEEPSEGSSLVHDDDAVHHERVDRGLS